MNTMQKFLLLLTCVTISACANRATATFDPGESIVSADVFYVERFPPDQRYLNKIIADNLGTRGYSVSTGEEGGAGGDATVIVTYRDKWQWDITMYLIELTITFRDPATNTTIATGNSYHTSLTRLSTEEMIDEVLNNMFAEDVKSP